jgi:signal transduction histidine kinase
MLAEAQIEATVCPTLSSVVDELESGAGFVVLTEEAIATADLNPLAHWLAAQEEWSDLPFILLTTRGGGLERNPTAARYLDVLGNVTFLERPFHPTTLVSLAQAALRGRQRQYEARGRLKELHDSAERYRSLFESIEAGFCIIEMIFDANGQRADYRFIEMNPAFVRHTGLDGALGRRVRELVPGHEQRWFDIYGRVALTGQAVRFEEAAEALGRWYDVYAFRVGDPAAHRVAVLFNDITKRRAMEEELRDLTTSLEQRIETATADREAALAQLHEAQKLETLGQLTGGVAHDFNNLLTPITGVLDLLNRRFGSPTSGPAADRRCPGVRRAGEGARQRLLGFARRQALQTRPVDLTALLEGMRDLITSAIGSGIELRLRLWENLPATIADPHQLELALLNLCVNARDAMPQGGVLTIAAETSALGPGEVSSVTPGLYVRISVIDSGVGMDEATLSRAVEPFFSTKELGKGTGLGLSMVHGLASQLGGGFKLTSTPSQGTRVDLWLPAASERPSTPLTSCSDESPQGLPPLSILLVDDEQLVRVATAEMLRELGHAVIEATSGADALTKLARGDFDVVVTDYSMPRMNGAELALRIRESRPDMPLLLVTGYSGPAQEASSLPRLDKPFRRAELAAAIQRVVSPPSNVVALRKA